MSDQKVMRAIRVTEFGEPSVLKLASDVPRPSPKEKEVLIKVEAAGVNPVETYIRSGQFPGLPTLPYTPGGDFAGVVQAVGPGVTQFKVGDRVFTALRNSLGAYAEYAVADVVSTFHLHDNLTFAQGAALGVPYLTAYKALMSSVQYFLDSLAKHAAADTRPAAAGFARDSKNIYMGTHIMYVYRDFLMDRGGAKAGEHILVHGASGAVGQAACQMAKAYGMKVVGTAGTADGLELARTCGAEEVYNHREKGYMDKIKAWTGGKGIDVILEMIANVNLANDLEILAPKGRVVVIGARGPIEIDPRATMIKETDIKGLYLFSSSDDEYTVFGEAVAKGAAEGWVKPVIGVEFKLEGADKAHEEVIAHKQGTTGKIILKV